MQAASNPTKALEVSNMSSNGKKPGRPPLPGKLTKEEREAKKAAQEAYEAEKAKREEAYEAEKAKREEAAAAQGAAGGGGDAERQAHITEFNNFLNAVQAEAAAENAAAEARRAAAVKAEAAYYASATTPVANPGRKGKGMFSNIPGSGFGVPNLPPEVTARDDAEKARDWIRAAGEKKVKKARELLARLKSGESYAALVAERDSEGQQVAAAEAAEVPVSKEVYRQQLAAAEAASELRRQELKAAVAWVKTARPEIWRTVRSLNDDPTCDMLIALHKQALAEDAAGRGSSAE